MRCYFGVLRLGAAQAPRERMPAALGAACHGGVSIWMGDTMADPVIGSGARQLTTSARLLLGGGLILVVAGLVTGELFALLLSHTINADLRAAWQDVLTLAGKADIEVVGLRFDEIHRLATERARAMSLHSHFGPYGLLAAALALFKTRLGAPGPYDLPATIFILAGGLLQSVGFLSLDYGATAWLTASNAGVVMLVLGIALYIPGLLPASSQVAAVPRFGEAGGRLLRSGVVLVFLGLVFGLFLAWRHVFFEEPALHRALRDLIGSIDAGDEETALSLYATYKSSQVRMAITAASHSHAVAFGFIMIVAALATEHLRLTRGWRNTSYLLIAVGGLLLPVFVYLAPRYGYVFALCADSAGGLVILGLLIVLIGLIPRWGADQ
jgi:hypothetical protein